MMESIEEERKRKKIERKESKNNNIWSTVSNLLSFGCAGSNK
jgi:hypothetical protein